MDAFESLPASGLRRSLKNTRRIHKHGLPARIIKHPVNNIAGGLRFVGYGGYFGAHQSIKQGGFAHIRTADKGYHTGFERFVSFCFAIGFGHKTVYKLISLSYNTVK